jgi:hypothetical protein
MTAPSVDRLRRLQALAEGGEGGERDNARRILGRLLERHPHLERELAAGPPDVDVLVPCTTPTDLIVLGYLTLALGCTVLVYVRGKGSRSTRIIRGPGPMAKIAAELYADERPKVAEVARMAAHGYAIGRFGMPDIEPEPGGDSRSSAAGMAAAVAAAQATERRPVHLQLEDTP